MRITFSAHISASWNVIPVFNLELVKSQATRETLKQWLRWRFLDLLLSESGWTRTTITFVETIFLTSPDRKVVKVPGQNVRKNRFDAFPRAGIDGMNEENYIKWCIQPCSHRHASQECEWGVKMLRTRSWTRQLQWHRLYGCTSPCIDVTVAGNCRDGFVGNGKVSL